MFYDPRPDMLYLNERIDKLEAAVKSILAVLEKVTNYSKENKNEECSIEMQGLRDHSGSEY